MHEKALIGYPPIAESVIIGVRRYARDRGYFLCRAWQGEKVWQEVMVIIIFKECLNALPKVSIG